MGIKIVIAFLLLILLSASCGVKKTDMLDLQVVDVKPAVRDSIELDVLFTGNIEAKDKADVFPRASGIVTQKLLKEGDPVKKGQPILLIERDEVGYKFKSMPLESPIDGFVGKISVDVGSYVQDRNAAFQDPAVVVVRPGDMRVKLDIPERYLPVIHPGTEITMAVDSLGNENFKGTILTSSPVIDKKTRTAKIEILVPNPEGKLRHGMFGRILLVVEKHENTLTVPYDSISWEGDKQFVYKVPDGKISRVPVKIGLRNSSRVEILEGINEGDLLVVGNLLDLKDGEEVKINNGQ